MTKETFARPRTHLTSLEQAAEIAQKLAISDILLTSGERPYFKIAGSLTLQNQFNPMTESNIIDLVKGMMEGDPKKKDDEISRREDLNFIFESVQYGNFRCHLARKAGNGVVLTIRIIPYSVKSLKDLMLPVQNLQTIIERKHGLILIVGPTGSGKSTTVAAMLEHLNQTSERIKHIITIEDPPEFYFRNEKCIFTQREIKGETTFASTLKSTLRQIPDVVFVGEIRDGDTMSQVLDLANTGHLVIATLHTHSPPTAISRVTSLLSSNNEIGKEQGQELLANNLIAVVSMKLVPNKTRDKLIPFCEIMLNNDGLKKFIETGEIDKIKERSRMSDTTDKQLFRAFMDNMILESDTIANSEDATLMRTAIDNRKYP